MWNAQWKGCTTNAYFIFSHKTMTISDMIACLDFVAFSQVLLYFWDKTLLMQSKLKLCAYNVKRVVSFSPIGLDSIYSPDFLKSSYPHLNKLCKIEKVK